MIDPDDGAQVRMNFFFSVDKNGADMVFEVKYRNHGVSRVSPIINFSVYCKDSKDAQLAEVAKKLIKEASSHIPVSE